jgi:hypothetical protein
MSGALLLIASLAPLQEAAGEVLPVDLELALAVDVSRSVDEEEARLQRDGYIAAFRHPNVVEAIRHGPLGRIAVSYYEWGGAGNTHTVVDWTVIGDAGSATGFADELARTTPMRARRTGISGAIDHGAALFDRRRFEGRRRVIDVSGDGANNSGEIVTVARDRAVAAGITINGLPILNGRASPSGWQQIDTLDLYYRDCVIGGPGAFHIVARDFQDFARAVLRKLVLEIAGAQPPGTAQTRSRPPPPRKEGPLLLRAATDARKAPPCDIGERRRGQQWYGDDTIMQPPAMRRRP